MHLDLTMYGRDPLTSCATLTLLRSILAWWSNRSTTGRRVSSPCGVFSERSCKCSMGISSYIHCICKFHLSQIMTRLLDDFSRFSVTSSYIFRCVLDYGYRSGPASQPVMFTGKRIRIRKRARIVTQPQTLAVTPPNRQFIFTNTLTTSTDGMFREIHGCRWTRSSIAIGRAPSRGLT